MYSHGIPGAAFDLLMLAGGAIMVPMAKRLETKFKPIFRNFAGIVAIMLTVIPGVFVGGYLGILLIRAYA